MQSSMHESPFFVNDPSEALWTGWDTKKWRDIDWHRELTRAIHQAPVDENLQQSKLAERMRSIAEY
ncbi:MAG: hypothetical protein U9R49_13500 [Bacteroidota bacterium]|nr:hypothetical protein [Bacteroidota bacterium]